MIAIPQSVVRRIVLKAYLSSDHVTVATGKTIAVVISKNGAAFANPSAGATNATEIGSGWYYVDLSTTDTGTQGPIIIRGTGTGVDDVETYRYSVDAHNAGFDALPSAVAAATGGIPTVDANNAVKVQSGTGANQISLASGAVTVGTNGDKTGYSLSVTPPTAVQIRTEMDANSTKLANLDATVSSRSTYAGGAVASVTAAVTVGTNNDKTGYALSASGVQAVWDALASALSTVGSIGKLIVTNLDALVSSRSTYAGGAVASVTAPVTVGTNNDKTGYSLSITPPTAVQIRTELDANSTKLANLDVAVSTRSTYAGTDTSGTTTLLGRLTGTRATNLDNLDAAISTRSTFAGGAVASVTSPVTVGTNNDKTGYGLSSAGIQAIWDSLTSALTTIGSIGKLLVSNIDAAISSRSTYAGGDTAGTTTLLGRLTGTRAGNLDNLDAAISTRSTYAGADTAGTTTLLGRLTSGRGANLDNLDATITSRSTFAGGAVASVTASVTVGTNNDKTGYGLSVTPPTAIEVRQEMDLNSTKLANLDASISSRSSHTAADVWAVTTRTLSAFGTIASDTATAVWGAASRTLSDFGFTVPVTVADKTGYSLTTAYDPAKTAAQAGDAMTLMGAYDTSLAAIKAKTDNLPVAPAAVADIPTATQNADALLKRDWTSVTGEASRSVLNALRFMRNKWAITSTTLSVKKEDDSTEAWNATITTNASQKPVSSADPN